ncbi:MAG: hypothetical protein FJ290_10130 [Planctomycetes bacterium]|nr:hypothetical protein [Planctomycetota bacterium]
MILRGWRTAAFVLLAWLASPAMAVEPPKKVYAHYMGCWPAGSGALAWARHKDLPNWFEMYWFGKWGDMRTATVADPKADPHRTGKTNLKHYLDQTDPTLPPLTERKAVE